MDFFQAQDSAHRNTTRLVIFFTLAVLSLIAITNLLVMVLFGFVETSEEGATLNSLATQFDWQVFFVVSAGVLIVIVGGSAYKTMIVRDTHFKCLSTSAISWPVDLGQVPSSGYHL